MSQITVIFSLLREGISIRVKDLGLKLNNVSSTPLYPFPTRFLCISLCVSSKLKGAMTSGVSLWNFIFILFYNESKMTNLCLILFGISSVSQIYLMKFRAFSCLIGHHWMLGSVVLSSCTFWSILFCLFWSFYFWVPGLHLRRKKAQYSPKVRE